MQGKSYKDRAGMRDYCSVEIHEQKSDGLTGNFEFGVINDFDSGNGYCNS